MVMKFKYHYLILCILWAASAGSAQESTFFGLHVGVNAANLTRTSATDTISTSTRTSFMSGGVYEFGLTDYVFLQAEVNYVSHGASFTEGGIDYKVKYDYFEFPFLILVKIGDNRFKPYLFGGPAIGFRINAETDATIDGVTFPQDNTGTTESMNISYDLGAGLEYAFKSDILFFGELRNSRGLTNIDKSADNSSITKTRGVQILVGGKFGF